MGKYIISSKLRKVGAQVDTKTGIHQFIVDEPIAGHGTDAGPNPVQYLLSAVTKIVVQIHAETNLDEAGHKSFMHSVVKDCTVHETLKHAVPIELQFI
ncbi:OsmC family protein [Lentilactobacillus parabuchneri]|uniref:OsmC family protein n=1 Tax=Lentilactobacillus parabuchneri TaxID=152331 RepID=UPI0022356E89|nr:OsmC family protein [Lentilactobacillus parabuchneri]MCW4399769.1 OsmC family protein [Lentilactobacillus parabuchneri]